MRLLRLPVVFSNITFHSVKTRPTTCQTLLPINFFPMTSFASYYMKMDVTQLQQDVYLAVNSSHLWAPYTNTCIIRNNYTYNTRVYCSNTKPQQPTNKLANKLATAGWLIKLMPAELITLQTVRTAPNNTRHLYIAKLHNEHHVVQYIRKQQLAFSLLLT